MKWREHCIVSVEKVTPVTICEVELNQVLLANYSIKG